MEADIIVDGFNCSVVMHGFFNKCICILGDGDRSVIRQLEKAKNYGPAFVIQKIECVNHTFMNHLRWLYDISSNAKMHLGFQWCLGKHCQTSYSIFIVPSLELSNTGKVKSE
ncbi:hypothetical protein PR048_013569 [Dryococelus australis]|uniref:Mutator-like transposase domain-containing protein n=1 Tax=Dryococelus australis TaxID=614101 RepID=A0ABQ9HSJ7_9NEOP|nr:hypothetical protein PR048_013569 [Dryococelus australis]